jgi:hypothetical protein
MPKRILDGEGIWRSDKIGSVQPVRARAEYANLLPLALANGSFECSALRVWSIVYSYNRPDVSVDDVQVFLDAFENAGLLFRWTAPDGKSWAYFVGIEKPGRLPGKSRKGRNEKVGAEPPQDKLRKFLESKISWLLALALVLALALAMDTHRVLRTLPTPRLRRLVCVSNSSPAGTITEVPYRKYQT